MCEVVRYYEQWVNGTGLPAVSVASGRLPKQGPSACTDGDAAAGEPRLLKLQPYDGCIPELPKLDRDALAPISYVLVHGSIATQDSCAFSDVDVAVFVDDCSAFSEAQHQLAVRELRGLLNAVLRYDPLMHHGLMFFPASGLRAYDQSFLPVEALACARVLHGSPVLSLQQAEPPAADFKSALLAAVGSVRRHFESLDFLGNDYRLKSLLSGALLMPARLLAAKGVHVYKRESFELARSYFKAPEWEFVARCEGLRSVWIRPRAPVLHRGLPAASHPRLRLSVASRMSPKLNVRRLSPRMLDGLIGSAGRFLNRLEAIA